MTRISWVALCLVVASCSDGDSSSTPRVLVVGIDGVRSDALEAASTPTLDALIEAGAYAPDAFAGGELGGPTEQRTLSGPGWSSILTGVWVDRHGVEFNDFRGSRFDDNPHFFHRIREQQPNAVLSSFVTWTPIHEEILRASDASVAFSPSAESSAEADAIVADEVVRHLTLDDPDVVFVHLDDPDAQGHRHTFSPDAPEYLAAIEEVDAQVANMVDAIRARSTFELEDWLFVVVSDHGGFGNLHGGQSIEERTIPLIIAGGRWEAKSRVSPGPGHVVVPPIVLDHLGLETDARWGWQELASTAELF